MIPPVSYQGNKTKLASQIGTYLLPKLCADRYGFYDICCGSGAISLFLIQQGYPPKQITMIDIGPWGLFWNEIGLGSFPLSQFAYYLKHIPSQQTHIKDYIHQLQETDIYQDTTCKFLLLQACNFGGKAVRIENNTWKNVSIKPYWQPHAHSIRKTPSSTFTTPPEILYQRVEQICEHAYGITGIYDNAMYHVPPPNALIYIDPIYKDTYRYGSYRLDLDAYLHSISACFVSESRIVTHPEFHTDSYELLSSQRYTSLNAKRKNTQLRKEYLSYLTRIVQ